MRLFVTHMPGFTPNSWPLVSFPAEATAERLRQEFADASPSASILYVGSQTAQMAEQRGRLLGLSIIQTDQVVDTLSHLPKTSVTADCYKTDGQFRWPFGLLISQAWFFDNQSSLNAKQHLRPQYSDPSVDKRGNYYELTNAETSKPIWNFKKTEVPLE